MQSTIATEISTTEQQLQYGWKFKHGKAEEAYKIHFDDSKWENVSVPHDWAIKGPFDKNIDKQVIAIVQNNEKKASEKTGRTGALPHIGEGWYRTHFEVPNYKKGKQVLLLFEGAMSEPKIYLNGMKVGEWNYGYSYFYLDITKHINASGKNLLAVKLSNTEKASRWYPGAGLYRNVRVIVKNREHFEQWGTFITTPGISSQNAKVNIKSKVSGQHLKLTVHLSNKKGDIVASKSSIEVYENEFDLNLNVNNPELWSPETPSLYYANLTLSNPNGHIVDRKKIPFGIRSIEYNTEKGFLLNGQIRKFKGVCLHHDLGPIGSAVNTAAIKRQLTILKDLGCDSIRSSHNMPSFEQLQLCDEMGFMFLAESFDEWAKPKVDNGYNRFFETDAEKDVVNLIRATRNHPCIVMWSSGNEVPDQHGAKGVKRAKWLQDIFHREDPTRPVTVGMDQVQAVMENGFGSIMDVPGLNYRVHLYEEAYEKFPQGFLLGSETASTVSSRGIYKFPIVKAPGKQYEDGQCSSYDMEYCNWSNLPEVDFVMQDDKPWVIGEFVWTGFDYLGEPTPYDRYWPSRSSYFGICDLAGLPKDRYYLYRSRWNKNDDTLHILPHWNWEGREGKTTPVFVYTNYNKAELFVNGKSQGTQKKSNESLQHRYRLMWNDVVYEPGTIKVIVYNEKNQVVGEKSVHTAKKATKLELTADRTELQADGKDISFITVSAVDSNGNTNPTATNQLNFKVEGQGIFRAVCNGDATSLEMFHLPTMKLFSGKLVVLVQSTKQSGEIKLTVSGKGLQSTTIKIQSK